MRIALVTTAVHDRRSLLGGALDTEALLELASEHDLHVFADTDTEGLQRLRDAEVGTHVAPKRMIDVPGEQRISSDEARAADIARLHADDPFDLLLYDAEQTADAAWLTPSLGDVPRGVVLTGGPVEDLRLIVDHAGLFAAKGRHLWATSGAVATADFVLADAPYEAWGLRSEAMPPRYALHASPPVVAEATGADLVVVVALHESPSGLGTLVPRVLERVPIDERGSLVVIHRDVAVGPESARDLIREGTPPAFAMQLVMATPDEDGLAYELLMKADAIIAATPADLAMPAVADANRPTMLLDGSTDPAPFLPSQPPPRTPDPEAVLLAVEGMGPLGRLFEQLEEGDVGFVVLHTPEASGRARDVLLARSSHRADLVVVGKAGPVFGDADPYVVDPGVLGVGRAAWATVRRRAERAGSLWELMVWMLGLSGTEHARLAVLPSSRGAFRRLPIDEVLGLPAWMGSTGVLPRPRLSGVTTNEDVPATAPVAATPSVREWAKSRRWTDRARLALPWRWGLLSRAMRGRW